MRLRLLPWLAAAMLAGAAGAAEDDRLVPPNYEALPSWFKVSFLDLGEDVAEAAAEGRRLVLYFYQHGCPYCARLLRVNLAQPDIVDYMRRHFDVVAINLWGDEEVTAPDGRVFTEKAFSEALRVQFTPTLLFLDEEGRAVLRLNGYYPPHRFRAALRYVAERREREEGFRDYLARLTPRPGAGPPPLPGALRPPVDLRALAAGQHPVLVLFEQGDCEACVELRRDILLRPDTRPLLASYRVVLLDYWGRGEVVAPDGRRGDERSYAAALDVRYTPTMVFLVDGREVFRVEAWFRTLHVQSALEYVASGAWRTQPNFQRYIQSRAERLRREGRRFRILD